MRTWPAIVLAVAWWGCSSELTPPGPGTPEDVRIVRLFDGAGQERTNHIFLFRNDTLHLEVRMYALDGHQITTVPGGVQISFAFDPPSIATSTPMPAEPLRRAVTTTAAASTLGSLSVSLLFLSDSSTKTFGPFECLVH